MDINPIIITTTDVVESNSNSNYYEGGDNNSSTSGTTTTTTSLMDSTSSSNFTLTPGSGSLNSNSLSMTPLLTSPTPSSPSVQPKKKTIDDFLLGRVLGEGSYGAVVLGTDKETNVQYAIKILEKKHIIKENKIKYVQIEKEIFCKCNHPNIVKLFFTFRSETCLYYVLELCSQGDLLYQLKKVGSFDYDTTKYYMAEIISALEHLHNLGIVHRDLKPENILMSAEMHIKITDFGTGKILDPKQLALLQQQSSLSNLADSMSNNNNNNIIQPSSENINNLEQLSISGNNQSESNNNDNIVNGTKTRANSFVGTAEYVSPELISNKETSTDSDLWALGCILYQLITGRLPFRGKTEFLTFQKVSNRDLVYPLNINPVVKDLIEKLLVMKPSDRLGSKTSIGGFDNLKKHEFFNGFDWDNLHRLPPPTIQLPKEKVIFDESTESLSQCSSPLQNSTNSVPSSNLSSSRDNNNNNNNNNIINNNNNSSNNLNSSSNSLRVPSTGNNTSQNNATIEKLSKFLNVGESIVEQSLVWKRKGFSIKKRYLVLISTPKLIYIDPKKMIVRGEIPLTNTVKAEIKNNLNFVIVTPKRKYNMEDIDHSPQRWVDSINNIVK